MRHLSGLAHESKKVCPDRETSRGHDLAVSHRNQPSKDCRRAGRRRPAGTVLVCAARPKNCRDNFNSVPPKTSGFGQPKTCRTTENLSRRQRGATRWRPDQKDASGPRRAKATPAGTRRAKTTPAGRAGSKVLSRSIALTPTHKHTHIRARSHGHTRTRSRARTHTHAHPHPHTAARARTRAPAPAHTHRVGDGVEEEGALDVEADALGRLVGHLDPVLPDAK